MPFKDLHRNPLTEWAIWFARKLRLEAGGRLHELGYLSRVIRCRFAGHNAVSEACTLVDVELGEHSYVGHHSHLEGVRIGKFCSIGPWVRAGLGNHPTRTFASSHPAFYSPIGTTGMNFADREYFPEHAITRIGNDVWIGAGALLVDGITVGDGAIIGAGSVVTRNVDPFTMVGGVPAKPIRKRFTDEEIGFLSAFKWWDRGEAWMREHWRDMHDVGLLMRKFRADGPSPG